MLTKVQPERFFIGSVTLAFVSLILATVGAIASGYIINNFYDTEMEGKTIEPYELVWDAVIRSNPAWKLTDNSYLMLKELQSIHDGRPPEQWELELSRHSLTRL